MPTERARTQTHLNEAMELTQDMKVEFNKEVFH